MSQAWPDSRAFWQDKQVIVTGGSGFLGAFVVDKLRERGAAEVIVPRQADYDLRDITAIRKLFADVHNSQLTIHNSQLYVIHLATHVGGIGANRAKPAEFFYDNLMMGVPLMHEAWRAGVEKFIAIGTVCAYPNPSTSSGQGSRPRPSTRTTSGTATRRRPTPPMVWPKR